MLLPVIATIVKMIMIIIITKSKYEKNVNKQSELTASSWDRIIPEWLPHPSTWLRKYTHP